MEYQPRRPFQRPAGAQWDPALRGCETVQHHDGVRTLYPSLSQEVLTNRPRSVELQRRLDSDPKLNNISVLGIDPGMMPTKITTGTLNWFIRTVFSIIAHIASRLSPNGMMRLPQKSAGDILAAALETSPPFGERPKGLYFNGSEPKEVSIEARDAEKRATVWKASVEYAELKDGETCLADWA